jgi:hypothetical protein
VTDLEGLYGELAIVLDAFIQTERFTEQSTDLVNTLTDTFG